jgi:hypothetical protein
MTKNTNLSCLALHNVFLRCCGCVSLETQLLHVWLPKKQDLLFMTPPFIVFATQQRSKQLGAAFVATVLQHSKQ